MPGRKWSAQDAPFGSMLRVGPRIVEMAPDPDAVELDPHPPVWVHINVEGRGVERCVGFAFKASELAVYVQLQYLGRTHHVWVERGQVTHRVIAHQRRT